MSDQCCKTCIHSRWWLTPTGRIKRDESGRCKAAVIEAVVPSSVEKPTYWRKAIQPDFGSDCPLYVRNEGKLIEDGVG